MTIGIKLLKHVSVRKANFIARFAIILFLIFTVSPLMACAPPIPAQEPTTPTGELAVTALTFIAEADAQVSETTLAPIMGIPPICR